MLHVRVVVPPERRSDVVDAVRDDPSVCHVLLLPDVGAISPLDEITFDVARENADRVLDRLKELGVEQHGSISVQQPDTVFSAAAVAAEQAAPGHPDDGVVWSQLESRSGEDARLSASFLIFLVLATLIAGVGRYLDQPILIIGAMVVGPEFAPIAATCLGIVRRRPRLVGTAIGTLAVGFALSAAVATVFWLVADVVGAVDRTLATTGPQTDFIIQPDGWSFVIALLAGAAGVLSMTASKSSTLVGVFISVTTVPAVGTLALTAAVGAWSEAGSALVQLGVNLAGMVLAGSLTLLALQVAWRNAPTLRRKPR